MTAEYAAFHDRMRACGLYPELHVGKFLHGTGEMKFRKLEELRVTHCDHGIIERERIYASVTAAAHKIEERMGGRHKSL